MNFCVFSALLDYIYSDSLPTDMDYGQDDEEGVTQMFRGLLLAADRYCKGRLKLLCEHELCKALDIENVIEMLEFANIRTAASSGNIDISIQFYKGTRLCADFRKSGPIYNRAAPVREHYRNLEVRQAAKHTAKSIN
ncbi:hypothetical protein PR202_gb25521 [Eleusine coracana subsp. coracana]|uniref:BTB domain-containing protein n=1 Tax=Eleusine coracana subsp. coracana TaxID=191504 RepID=A0AAV5FNS5_ELECO|nr:hypothetical protein PR202_gb25521 [Eleusine coracana subsp. coracana]